MFERFTESSRLTLFIARWEATEIGGAAVEAERVLLGLLRVDKGWRPNLFAAEGLSYGAVRQEIRAHWGTRSSVPVSEDLPFSEQVERILRYAVDEADRAAQKYVGSAHVLLGLLGEEGSFAAQMLARHGMTIDAVRERVGRPP